MLVRDVNSDRNESRYQQIELGVGLVDSANISTIFILFLTEVTRKILAETARFILFPLNLALALVRAGLAIRKAKLENGKNGTLGKALIEGVSAVAIGVAVIGGLVAGAIFASVSPIIFVSTLAVKTFYNIGSAFYYWGKSTIQNSPEQKQKYRNMARAHAVGAVALTFATVAVGFVMIAAKHIVAILGIVAGVISASFVVYNVISGPRAKIGVTDAKPVEIEGPASHKYSNGMRSLYRVFIPKPADRIVAAKDQEPLLKSVDRAPQLKQENDKVFASTMQLG